MQNAEEALLDQLRKFPQFHQPPPPPKKKGDPAAVDELTGLANRCATEAYLQYQLQSCKPVTGILIDLQEFKMFNETWGRRSGNRILTSVALRLTDFTERFDVVSRWAEDKFLLVSELSHKQGEYEKKALRKLFHAQFEIPMGDRALAADISASVGVAYAMPGDTLGQLLARAAEDSE